MLRRGVSLLIKPAKNILKQKYNAAPLISSRIIKFTSSSFSTDTKEPKKGKWVEVEDKETGEFYWWNEETDETTELGAMNPDDVWELVEDKDGFYFYCENTDETTSLSKSKSQAAWMDVKCDEGIYYWNVLTNETTEVGADRPE